MKTEIKNGKALSAEELLTINSGQRREFGLVDTVEPFSEPINPEALFVIVKNDFGQILAFGKLHEIGLVFHSLTYPILCISTLVSLDKGKGYGRILMKEIVSYLNKQRKTAVGFCETKLLPFYEKCGVEFLANDDNHFFYLLKNGETITDPKIVPGEVIFVRGKDGFMDIVLASADKRVGVID